MNAFEGFEKLAGTMILGGVLSLAPWNGTGAGTLSLPDDAAAPHGRTLSVHLHVDDAAGMVSADGRIEFSPTVLQAVAVSTTPSTAGFQLAYNLATPGVVLFSLFSATPLVGSGDLVRLDLQVLGTLGQATPLDLASVELDEGAIPATLQDGTFVVLPTYRVQMMAADAGGADSISASYRAGGSCGQEMTVGVSSNPSRVLQSGFWSFAGSGIVPVVLAVSPVLLSWSGNNPPYSVYRSTDCGNVTSSLLEITSGNSLVDSDLPAAGAVFCYRVQSFAPGS